MSAAVIADLLPTRLYFVAIRGGVARKDGVEVRLTAAPDLGDGPVDRIDYAPGEIAAVMYPRGPWRDMFDYEVVAAVALLDALTKGARDASA